MESARLVRIFERTEKTKGKAAAIQAVIEAARKPVPMLPLHRDPVFRGAVQQIINGVARRHGVPSSLVRGRSRQKAACAARCEVVGRIASIVEDEVETGLLLGVSPRAVRLSLATFEARVPELAASISRSSAVSEIRGDAEVGQ